MPGSAAAPSRPEASPAAHLSLVTVACVWLSRSPRCCRERGTHEPPASTPWSFAGGRSSPGTGSEEAGRAGSRRYLGNLRRGLGLADVTQHVRPVLQVDADLVGGRGAGSAGMPLLVPGVLLCSPSWCPPDRGSAHLDDVEAHVDDVLGAGAIVPGPGVTLQGVAQVPTVQIVVTQVIVAAPVGPDMSRPGPRATWALTPASQPPGSST